MEIKLTTIPQDDKLLESAPERAYSLEVVERAAIERALQLCEFNITTTAKLLRINRRTLQRKLYWAVGRGKGSHFDPDVMRTAAIARHNRFRKSIPEGWMSITDFAAKIGVGYPVVHYWISQKKLAYKEHVWDGSGEGKPRRIVNVEEALRAPCVIQCLKRENDRRIARAAADTKSRLLAPSFG